MWIFHKCMGSYQNTFYACLSSPFHSVLWRWRALLDQLLVTITYFLIYYSFFSDKNSIFPLLNWSNTFILDVFILNFTVGMLCSISSSKNTTKIFTCIIIIMSRRQRGYPWPSLAISPYHSSPLAGLQGYILCPHIVAVCRFVLVVPLLHIHMWGSTGVHRLWARPCFSSSVLRVWFVELV